MNPTHLTKAKSRSRLLPFRSFSTSHTSVQVESSPVQVEPSPESKTKGKFLPHFLRSFSTSHSSLAHVEPSHESCKTKGKFLPHFLRSFSLRSTAGALVTDARSKGTSKGSYGKAHSLNSSVYSAAFSSDGVSDGSSKDLRCGQQEDDPSKRSRWMHIKNVRGRLVNPLKSMRDSYVECMTAAAGDPRLPGLSMGYQGPCTAQLRAGFPSDYFRPYSSQIGHTKLSDEHIRAILEKSKSFGEAIPEE